VVYKIVCNTEYELLFLLAIALIFKLFNTTVWFSMGESNTPPVSPREPDVEEIDSDRDDEDPGLGTLGEEDFEVIELQDDDEEDVADEENEEQYDGEQQDIEEDSIDVPDDAIVVFKNHGSNVTTVAEVIFLCSDHL